MAVINAANTGNWSSSATWPGGVFPTSADDVYANGKTVTIDQNITVLSLRTTAGAGGVAGGSFIVNTSRTVTATNIYSGSSTCLTSTPPFNSTVTINGNCLSTLATSGNVAAVNHNGSGITSIFGNVEASGNTSLDSVGVWNSGGLTGVLNITGTVRGGMQGNAFGVSHISPGTTNVFGDIYANNTGSNRGRGLRNNGQGTVNITGNVYGQLSEGVDFYFSGGVINVTGNVYGGQGYAGLSTGFTNTVTINGNVYPGTTGANSHGVSWQGAGICTINGDVFGDNVSGTNPGSNGVRNFSTGTILVNGNARSGNFGTAVWNNSTGTVYVLRAIGNGYGPGSTGSTLVFGVVNNAQGVVRLREIECGTRGHLPVYGVFTLDDASTNVFVCKLTTAGTKTLVDANSSGLMPAVTDVRSGVSYNAGNLTGTCAVPTANSVAAGVAVDNTVGTAALTQASVWDYALSSASSVAGSVGEKLKKTAIPADIIALS